MNLSTLDVITGLGRDNSHTKMDVDIILMETGLDGNITHTPVNYSIVQLGEGPPPGNKGTTGEVALPSVVSLSILFCIIGIIGIIGNSLVIFIILTDRKMRRSVTNLFIMNLAISDLLIMLFGIPEIVMFMLNHGWLLGPAMCKVQRYVLVFSLYSSVITQVSVCIERLVFFSRM